MFKFKSKNLVRSRKNAKSCSFTKLAVQKEKEWEEVDGSETLSFECKLETRNCEYLIDGKRRCKNRTRKFLPYCWLHTQLVFHLNVGRSTIKGAGRGLFACDRSKSDDEVVFKKGDKVALYARKNGKQLGEFLTNQELIDRYGRCVTGVYSVDTKDEKIGVDTACERSIASYANTSRDQTLINTFPKWFKNNELWLVATKDILNHEEIMWDYGESYRFDYPEFFEHSDKTTNLGKTNARCRNRKSRKRSDKTNRKSRKRSDKTRRSQRRKSRKTRRRKSRRRKSRRTRRRQ